MDANFEQKLEGYLSILARIKTKVQDERTAVSLLQEISKDIRMEQIKEEREAKNGEPATDKQKKLMAELGIKCPKGITKKEASAMLSEELGR